MQVATWRSVKLVGKNKIKPTSHGRAKVNAREQGDVLTDACAPIGLFYRTMHCCSQPFVFPQPEAKFTSWSTAVAKTSLFPQPQAPCESPVHADPVFVGPRERSKCLPKRPEAPSKGGPAPMLLKPISPRALGSLSEGLRGSIWGPFSSVVLNRFKFPVSKFGCL